MTASLTIGSLTLTGEPRTGSNYVEIEVRTPRAFVGEMEVTAAEWQTIAAEAERNVAVSAVIEAAKEWCEWYRRSGDPDFAGTETFYADARLALARVVDALSAKDHAP